MKVHRNQVHNSYPVSCPDCGKSLNNLIYLMKHIIRHKLQFVCKIREHTHKNYLILGKFAQIKLGGPPPPGCSKNVNATFVQ